MPITGNSSYIPTVNEFYAHWGQCNTALTPQNLTVRRPDNTTCTQMQFLTLRNTLQASQNQVQGCLGVLQMSRGQIMLAKEDMLLKLNRFTALLDGYYKNTDFYAARPYAPSLSDGQEAFTRPLVDAMLLWEKVNAGPAPGGVTLPLELGDGTTQGAFASAVSALQFLYAEERNKAQELTLARARRNRTQFTAYETMKAYREAVPGKLVMDPELVETLPRLSPLPGHTPEPVNASAVFEAPNMSKVIFDGSTDPLTARYELRGTIGDRYDDQDAVVVATRLPGEPREFITGFGLNQPGAEVAFKVYVVLATGNEAGSAPMRVERPVGVELLAAA